MSGILLADQLLCCLYYCLLYLMNINIILRTVLSRSYRDLPNMFLLFSALLVHHHCPLHPIPHHIAPLWMFGLVNVVGLKSCVECNYICHNISFRELKYSSLKQVGVKSEEDNVGGNYSFIPFVT